MELTILRIYMPLRAKWSGHLSRWQRLMNSSLSYHLLKQANLFGIEQGICHRVSAGYLDGKKLLFEGAEISPPDLPQCVELIDKEGSLIEFYNKYKEELKQCHVVLFTGTKLLN